MDPDSFKGKVLLSVIDKALIGGAVYIVFLFCNSVYDQHQRELEEAIAVSKVHTEILSRQRERMINHIQQYLELEERMAEGRPSRELVGKLGDCVTQLRLSSIQVGPIAPKLGLAVDSLADDMLRLHGLLNRLAYDDVEADMTSVNQRRELAEAILTRYERFLEQLRSALVRSIREDMSSSSESANDHI